VKRFKDKPTNKIRMKISPYYRNGFQVIGIAWLIHVMVQNYELLFKILAWSAISSVGGFVGFQYGKHIYIHFYTKEDKEESSYEKYQTFIQIHYDDMKKEFDNPEYRNHDIVKSLKDENYHLESKLPFDYSPIIKFFYHDEDKVFHYYTKTSNIPYNVLNTICREYVLKYRCLQLYEDENEIETYQKNEDFIHIEESEEDSDTDSLPPPKEDSIFYFKPIQKEHAKKQEKKINVFIHKGNILDYDNTYHINKENPVKEKQPITYEEFMTLQESSL